MQELKKNQLAVTLFDLVLLAIGLYMIIEGRTYRGNDKYFPIIVGALQTGTAIWMLI